MVSSPLGTLIAVAVSTWFNNCALLAQGPDEYLRITILVWNERQLRAAIAEYTRWYNAGRVHQGIHGIPDPDPELLGDKPADGKLVARPVCGGLHHDYRAVA